MLYRQAHNLNKCRWLKIDIIVCCRFNRTLNMDKSDEKKNMATATRLTVVPLLECQKTLVLLQIFNLEYVYKSYTWSVFICCLFNLLPRRLFETTAPNFRSNLENCLLFYLCYVNAMSHTMLFEFIYVHTNTATATLSHTAVSDDWSHLSTRYWKSQNEIRHGSWQLHEWQIPTRTTTTTTVLPFNVISVLSFSCYSQPGEKNYTGKNSFMGACVDLCVWPYHVEEQNKLYLVSFWVSYIITS